MKARLSRRRRSGGRLLWSTGILFGSYLAVTPGSAEEAEPSSPTPTFSRSLDTFYECLVAPTPSCDREMAPVSPPEPPKPPAQPATAPAPPPKVAPPKPAVAAVPLSVASITPRVAARKPTTADLHWLHKQVGLVMPVDLGKLLLPLADNPHETGGAAQLLAWCYLNGIGVPASATSAYALYRLAGDLGVPGAREGQVAVFRNASSEMRNKILMLENMR